MHLSRVVHGGAVLFALVLVIMLATVGCSQKLQHKSSVTIDCIKKITVDPNTGVVTHHKAAYVCGGDTVKWDAQAGVHFTVHFPGACPFNPCPDITDAQPTAVVAIQPPPDDLTVYKYTITVNATSFDPHVVGGGGH